MSGWLKFAVIADPHLGAKWGTIREQDSFIQFREAIEKSLELEAQLIIILGDIFDTRIPKQEAWARAMRILSIPAAKVGSEVTLDRVINKNMDEISPVALRGIPVVAIHGNHERRTRGLTNPVEALEAAGLLVHLHHNTLVFHTLVGMIAIHGMSNVPEQHAPQVLTAWNPKPVEGATNIFTLHQSIGKFVYSSDGAHTLDTPNLPAGFDLYLCGHVHSRNETSAHGKPLIFPGSTERTQMVKVESETPKGFYMVKVKDGLSCTFVELKSQRDFYYREMRFNEVTIPDLSKAVREKIEELLQLPRKNTEKLPMMRLRLIGSMSKEASRGEFDERAITEEFNQRTILVIGKADLETAGLGEKLHMLREGRDRRISIDEMAMTSLEDILKDVPHVKMFDIRTLYDLLISDRSKEALQRIYSVVENLVNADLGGKKNDNLNKAEKLEVAPRQ